MKNEIERKFLLRNEGWRAEAVGVERIRDGLIGLFGGGKVRVRLADSFASVTIKSDYDGLSRREFEYSIPQGDAELMLGTMCGDFIFEKSRHCVMHAGFEWSVDIYTGRLEGAALAEIELDREDQDFPLPPWIGQEVSGDWRFRKRNMFRLAQASPAPLTVEYLLGLPSAEPWAL